MEEKGGLKKKNEGEGTKQESGTRFLPAKMCCRPSKVLAERMASLSPVTRKFLLLNYR